MKKILLAFLICYSTLSFSQNIKDCNELFDKDIREKYSSFNRSDVKKFLLKYSFLEKENRSDYASNSGIDLSLGIPLDEVPIELGFGSSSQSESYTMNKLTREILDKNYVSDEDVNVFVSSVYPSASFESYKECLATTERVLLNQNGVFAMYEGDLESNFIVKLTYKSPRGDDKITIDKAIFDGASLKYHEEFSKGTVIEDKKTIYQHLIRKKGEPLNITIQFKEPVTGVSKSFESEYSTKKYNAVPIGTIVSSILDYNSFLEVNDLDLTSDMTKAYWVPCDGRNISSTTGYGRFSGGKVPDLRGVFLRGLNDFGSSGVGVVTIPKAQANPENKKAGEFQNFSLEKHRHFQFTGGDRNGFRDPNTNQTPNFGLPPAIAFTEQQRPYHIVSELTFKEPNLLPGGYFGTSNETRPKNISVYYYIKIN